MVIISVTILLFCFTKIYSHMNVVARAGDIIIPIVYDSFAKLVLTLIANKDNTYLV